MMTLERGVSCEMSDKEAFAIKNNTITLKDYAEEVFEAAKRGIKIFPLASSGLDDQGEYIFRQLAQITSGKFLFLTYGANGMPGNDTSHHVDDYSVLSLDQLIIRLVEEELANARSQFYINPG